LAWNMSLMISCNSIPTEGMPIPCCNRKNEYIYSVHSHIIVIYYLFVCTVLLFITRIWWEWENILYVHIMHNSVWVWEI
jgi:hypothetical protein